MSSTAMTNAFFPGQRFQIERYHACAGEYLQEPNDRHVLVQMRDSRGLNVRCTWPSVS